MPINVVDAGAEGEWKGEIEINISRLAFSLLATNRKVGYFVLQSTIWSIFQNKARVVIRYILTYVFLHLFFCFCIFVSQICALRTR